MAEVVLFVHGTGVRGPGWADSFKLVKQRLLCLDPTIRVQGCYWGGSEGVKLHEDGASIPKYDKTGGFAPPPSEDIIAQWAVLYTDPWYELRLLGDWPPNDESEQAPGQESATDRLAGQLKDLVPSEATSQLLARDDLGPSFEAALAALRTAPEFERAAGTATDASLNEYRKAVARALVAFTVVGAEDAGIPVIDGATRDEILAAVTDDLHGFGLGITAWLSRPFQGMAMNLVTQRVTRKRGAVTDATAPMAGDIIRYQSRGSGIRRYLRQVAADAVADDPDPSITLIGHSLGGIACVDALIEAPIPGVRRLVTIGSQAPFFYEIDALSTLKYGQSLPDHFPAWLNIYDGRDILSYIGAGVFPGRVTDEQVDNGQPFPRAHSAYWRNKAVWDHVGGFLA